MSDMNVIEKDDLDWLLKKAIKKIDDPEFWDGVRKRLAEDSARLEAEQREQCELLHETKNIPYCI